MDDLLAFSDEAGCAVGFAKAFFTLPCREAFAAVSLLKHAKGMIFSIDPAVERVVFVQGSIIIGAFPYFRHGNFLYVVASMDVLS